MTRKDYILIAAALNSALQTPDYWYASNCDSQYEKGAKSAINALAVSLASDNPRFDRERFLKACGVTTGEQALPAGYLCTRICETCNASFIGSDPRFCPVCHAKAHAGSPI